MNKNIRRRIKRIRPDNWQYRKGERLLRPLRAI